jgi:hypothetical protein
MDERTLQAGLGELVPISVPTATRGIAPSRALQVVPTTRNLIDRPEELESLQGLKRHA